MKEVRFGETLIHVILWDGPGTYVARRMRGPLEYHKLPEGKEPKGDVVVHVFLEEPKLEPKEDKNALWR